jgi:hypothetical protein
MVSGTSELTIGIEGICHAPLNPTGVAFNNDVRCIARGPEFAESQGRRFAGDIALVDKSQPREVGQMALSARKKEPDGQCGRRLSALALCPFGEVAQGSGWGDFSGK